jgi:hypothetical protein
MSLVKDIRRLGGNVHYPNGSSFDMREPIQDFDNQ